MRLFKRIISSLLKYKDVWTLKDLASKKYVYNMAYYKKLQKNCSWISHEAIFKNIPCFPHGILGIFVSGSAKIGKNCVIFQHVTIGSNTLDNKFVLEDNAPYIGDNCYIGAGAKIIGNIKVGNNCRIGANTCVYHDIPDNCTVVAGGGMRIIKHNCEEDNRYYSSINGRVVYWEDGCFKEL